MDDLLLTKPVVDLEWPSKATLNLFEACSRLGLEDDFERVRTDLAALAALSTAIAPVVGITGTLNAGKTSTVKRFLSPTGRARAPSGIGKATGTQRFVFWLPVSWRSQPEIWEAFKGGLEALFGNRLEELSEDPKTASLQYQGHGNIADQMAIPLYAFDEGLDQFGFALMDSPDMERTVEGLARERSSEIRIKLVRQALRGLSAVLVLCEASKAEIELLKETLSTEEGIRVFLLLNQIGCNPGELDRVVKDEAVSELRHALSVTDIFAAFHGRFEGARNRISELLGTDEFDPDLPHFFRVAPSPEDGQSRILLEEALKALEPAQLWQDRINAKHAALQAELIACTDHITTKLNENRLTLQKARDDVLRFVREQVVAHEKNELAIPLMPSTAAQIAEAIMQHSPLYAKPTMHLQHHVGDGVRYLKERREKLRAMVNPARKLEQQASKVAHSVEKDNIPSFHPQDWATRSQDKKFMPDDVDRERLVQLWTQVGTQAINMDVELNRNVLKEFAESLWASVPWWKKVGLSVCAPIALISGLAALVLAVVDGGATSTVLFFSVKELLVFLGVGTAVTPAFMAGAGKSLEKDLIKRAAIPFYENLIKGALDSFGLPRSGLSEVRERFFNTGDFVLDLTSTERYQPLTKGVDLSGGRVLGRLKPDIAPHLFHAASESHSEVLGS